MKRKTEKGVVVIIEVSCPADFSLFFSFFVFPSVLATLRSDPTIDCAVDCAPDPTVACGAGRAGLGACGCCRCADGVAPRLAHPSGRHPGRGWGRRSIQLGVMLLTMEDDDDDGRTTFFVIFMVETFPLFSSLFLFLFWFVLRTDYANLCAHCAKRRCVRALQAALPIHFFIFSFFLFFFFGTDIYDVGKNIAGVCVFRMSGSGTITFRYGELLHADGSLNFWTSVAGQVIKAKKKEKKKKKIKMRKGRGTKKENGQMKRKKEKGEC